MRQPMLSNPNECRARAAYCVEIAAETTSTIVKTAFSDFARQWAKLATDIEMRGIGRRGQGARTPQSSGRAHWRSVYRADSDGKFMND
jgi:hypothetical protein